VKVSVRRLPIAEYAPDAMKPVLNIDSVLVALHYQYISGDWKEALREAIPVRYRTKDRLRQDKGNVIPEDLTLESIHDASYKDIKRHNLRGVLSGYEKKLCLPPPEISTKELRIEGSKFHDGFINFASMNISGKARGRSAAEAIAKCSFIVLVHLKERGLIEVKDEGQEVSEDGSESDIE
jgi:hypothetical protein